MDTNCIITLRNAILKALESYYTVLVDSETGTQVFGGNLEKISKDDIEAIFEKTQNTSYKIEERFFEAMSDVNLKTQEDVNLVLTLALALSDINSVNLKPR